MRKKIILFVVLAFLMSSCLRDSKTKQAESADNQNFNLNKTDTKVETIKPCLANDIALFLAGKPTERYSNKQSSDYYQEYANNLVEQWQQLSQKTLNPLKQWKDANIKSISEDTTCLFYPFGGPDMLFAYTFFPNMNNYVLFGLENPGQLPELDDLSQNQIQDYLDNLMYSFRYVNKFGFFVASHMRDDFNNKVLNGTLHLVLYTLAIENCIITNYRPISINSYGKVVDRDYESKEKNPYGYEIKFVKQGQTSEKTITYIRIDASNPPMTENLNFAYFIHSFNKKTCYLKSASYLLQDVAFTVMRNLILSQCDVILQDESGIAYSEVKKNFDVKLFGTYTRPMKVFSKFKQEDLKNALLAANSQPLPFKIGYASQINESVIMACRRKTSNKHESIESAYTSAEQSLDANAMQNVDYEVQEGVVYKVQFKVSWNKIPDNELNLTSVPDIDYYTDGSYYKYTAGNCKTQEECNPILEKVRKAGYSDAFIIKFVNGKRIK